MLPPIIDLNPKCFAQGIPHSVFAELRQRSPLFRTELPDGTVAWNLCRYADIRWALKAIDKMRVLPHFAEVGEGIDPEGSTKPWKQESVMNLHPPEHGPHRQSLAVNVRQDYAEQFRPVVRTTAQKFAVEAARGPQPFDGVDDFAAPLAAAITCAYLGIDSANRGFVQRLSALFMGDRLPPRDVGAHRDIKIGQRSLRALHGSPMRAAMELVHESWAQAPWLNPGFVNEAPPYQIEDFAMQHLTAGVAGLRTAISVALLELTRSRYRTDLWRNNLTTAADETLRYSTPLLRVKRLVTKRVEIHGQALAPGDLVFLWFASGNFDPQQFLEPQDFDPVRSPNPHLSLSFGIHHCLGAPIVKIEIEECLRAMLDCWEKVQLAGEPSRFASNVVNDIHSLPLHALESVKEVGPVL